MNDPRILQNVLVKGWLEGNQDLFGRFVGEIDNSDIEQVLFRLLVETDCDDDTLTRLWCCLLLDGRETTQQAFTNGLGDALLDENSTLRMRVKIAKQTKMLEQYQKQIRSLQGEVDLWKQRYEQEVEERRREHNTYEADHAQQTETAAELGNTITDLQAEKTKIQQDLTQMQNLYEQEQGTIISLQSEVTQLKQDLAEAYQHSDEVIGENVQLKSNVKRLTEWGKTIETERDAEIRKRRELQKQLEDANKDKEIQEHLKQTAIHQYHQLQASMEQPAIEIAKYHSLSPSQLDIAWQQSLITLSQHFSLSLAQWQGERHAVTNEEKLADWQYWQEEEEALVRHLFSSSQLKDATRLIQVETAQRLLLVRWYLLEWLRSTVSQALRVANDHKSQD